MNINQSNAYRKDLSWLHFEDDQSVQERQQVKDQQSYVSVFVAYRTFAARSTSPDMTSLFHARPYGRFKEIQNNLRRRKVYRTNQGCNFLGGSFSNRDTVRAPIQFRRERQPHHLKRGFFLKNRLLHFHINSISVIRPFRRNKLSFSSIEINKTLLAPVLIVS